jgi:hypothetical protein
MYIWEDEAYSLHTSSYNLAEVIRLSYNFEGQPAFYFVLLSIWRNLNASIFFARLLSVIFIGLSAYFFSNLLSLFAAKEGKRWMIIIFLLNPFTVWAALEIRLYALVVLLSTASIFYFLKYYFEEKGKYLYILLAISLIGLYTQYFFALLIVSFALSVLLLKGWRKFFEFCFYFIPVIILFLPNIIFLRQQISMGRTYLPGDSYKEKILEIVRTPQDFLLALQAVKMKQSVRWIIKIPFMAAFLLVLFRIFKEKKSSNISFERIVKILVLTTAALSVLFILVVVVLKLYYQEKYFLITFPLFLLLFNVFLFSQRRSIIFTVIGLYFICLLIIKYQFPEKTYNFENVSNYIQKISLKNEPVIFYGKSILPPFQYYYTGSNRLYTLPPLVYDKDYYEERIQDTAEFNKEIKDIKSPTDSYLLVTESITGFKYKQAMSRAMIQKSIRDRYIISLDTTFNSRNSDNFLRVERLENERE